VFFSLTITKTKIFVNEGKSFSLTKTKTKVYMKLKRNSENENDIVLNELNQDQYRLNRMSTRKKRGMKLRKVEKN
jgi:precorrin-2 methylase